MKSVDTLVQRIFDKRIRRLADRKSLDAEMLADLRFRTQELIYGGLCQIFIDHGILSTRQPGDEAYEQTIGPDVYSVFDYIAANPDDRDGIADLCDRCSRNMAEKLSLIVEKYKTTDVPA